ncbi:uncharacterized protein LOC121375704 [Gigantopelta aegis]|uniref:uncharacterized protein LOC121375704 n=1 Tax=Gigantopelta aegis TaxID=1735272 RepID=UPI001B88E4C4|nr:uncharacterized protein LOC121375704 [Gigantopelta aegis]
MVMDRITAELYSSARIGCYFSGEPAWGLVGFFRRDPTGTGYKAVSGFAATGTNNVFLNNISPGRNQTGVNTNYFYVDFENITCQDVGTYFCISNTGVRSIGSINITLPKFPITLEIPNDIQENKTVTLKCTGVVSPQSGRIFWSVKQPGETTFAERSFSGDVQVMAHKGACTNTLRRELTTTFDLSWNGTEIRCETENPAVQSEVTDILVLPGDFCDPYPAMHRLQHPYDCQSYITCIPGLILTSSCPGDLCYDQLTDTCVAKTGGNNASNGACTKRRI